MNQAILKPKEEDRYLAVVVPNGYKIFNIKDQRLYYKRGHLSLASSVNLLPVNFQSTNYEIIGLLSNITEEQAKEILDYTAGSVFNWYKNYLGKNKWVSYKNSMNSLIKASGLTYTSEQDVLIIKINRNENERI